MDVDAPQWFPVSGVTFALWRAVVPLGADELRLDTWRQEDGGGHRWEVTSSTHGGVADGTASSMLNAQRDAVQAAVAFLKRLAIAEGRADVDAGRTFSHAQMCAWLDSWGTPNELPPPSSCRRDE